MIKSKKIIFIISITFFLIAQANSTIKDSLLGTVGNLAITKSDILNEIKIILILNNDSYSDDKREKLYKMAIKSTVKRSIKKIEIERNNLTNYSKKDLSRELTKLANSINMDLDTLKNICSSNNLDFSLIEDQVITELLWNSLIFHLYKDRLTINVEEIEEQLKLISNKKKTEEFLISEIVFRPDQDQNLESAINEIKNKININGFKKVAMDISISETAVKGGDLGWLNENIISKKFKSIIINTPVGNISEPVILPQGILIFKVRDKRITEKKLNIEEEKDLLVKSEKMKILNMFSLSHYDQLRRSIAVKIFNE